MLTMELRRQLCENGNIFCAFPIYIFAALFVSFQFVKKEKLFRLINNCKLQYKKAKIIPIA